MTFFMSLGVRPYGVALAAAGAWVGMAVVPYTEVAATPVRTGVPS